MIQVQLGDMNDFLLIEAEKATSADLQKWLGVQEKVFKEKSKAYKIEERDDNNNYFFKCIKARASNNTISVLKALIDRLIHKNTEIEKEVTQFYQELLGSTTTTLPSVKLSCIRIGIKFNIQQQIHMCRPVFEKEIQETTLKINNNKTLGVDRYTICFFKKAWHIVKKDIKEGVKEFFEEKKMLAEMNGINCLLK